MNFQTCQNEQAIYGVAFSTLKITNLMFSNQFVAGWKKSLGHILAHFMVRNLWSPCRRIASDEEEIASGDNSDKNRNHEGNHFYS
jgi:hypothetical protein